MRTRAAFRAAAGFGVLDLMATVAIAVIAGVVLVPILARPKTQRCRAGCISNVMQIGLAFRMWATDHQDQFPFVVSATNGGTLEFAESEEVFRHFLAASNELNSPKLLACPMDVEARRQIFWTSLSNTNISYFVGLDANEAKPETILAGDRNIVGGVKRNGAIMEFTNHATAEFTGSMHTNQGNFVLADGSASQATTDMLRTQLEKGALPVRFAIPRVDQRSALSLRSRWPLIGAWTLVAISAAAAIFLYTMLTRRFVLRAASG